VDARSPPDVRIDGSSPERPTERDLDPPPPLRLRGQVDDEPRGATPRAVARSPDAEGVQAQAATEAAVDRLGVDVEVLHAIRGAYPTSAVPAYGAHRGIEALHVALAKVGRVGGLRLGDTDDDGRLEILDAWGRPLVYFSPDDYGSVQRWAPGDGASVEVAARRDPATSTHLARGSYQLWSAGPDGRVGRTAGDDVTSWVTPD
jgi:hypothetical protein